MFVLLIFLVFCVVCFQLCVFVLCYVCPMLPVSLDCPFLIAPSVFSSVYLQFLWIVHSFLPVLFFPVFIYSFSGLSILFCPFCFFQCLFTVSLDCLLFFARFVFSSVYLQFLWIVNS